MTHKDEHIVIFCTVPNKAEGEKIVGELIGLKLAACVNIIEGLTSFYRWEGEVHRDPESLLIIKSLKSHFPALEAKIRQLHRYETPEIIALPIVAGSEKYLKWITAEVKPL